MQHQPSRVNFFRSNEGVILSVCLVLQHLLVLDVVYSQRVKEKLHWNDNISSFDVLSNRDDYVLTV